MAPYSILDNLLNSSDQEWLDKNCPPLINENGEIRYQKPKIKDREVIDAGEYYDMVERGNVYIENLLDKEEIYLTSKYGSSLYNYFKTERSKYIDSKVSKICEVAPPSLPPSIPPSLPPGNIVKNESLKDELMHLNNIHDIFKEIRVKGVKITKQTNDKSDLHSRRFSYRSQSVHEMKTLGNRISLLYFFIVTCTILYLLINRRVDIKKKWWGYAIVLLIPLILDRFYLIIVKLYYYAKQRFSVSGPANAFLNESFV